LLDVKKVSNLIGLVLFFILIISVLGIYSSGSAFIGNSFVNSDSLYLPILFQDVLSNKGSFINWYLTPAPYFFPDYLIYFMAYIIGINTYIQIVTYAILQIIFLFLVTALLSRQLTKRNNHFLIASVSTIILLWFGLNNPPPYQLLLLSAHHYGAFISEILFIAIWLKQIKKEGIDKNNSKKYLSFLCVLAGLVACSDLIFIVQTLIPYGIITTLFLIKDKKPINTKYIWPFLPLIFGLLVALIYGLLVKKETAFIPIISLESTTIRLGQLLQSFREIRETTPKFALYFYSYLVITGITMIKGIFVVDAPEDRRLFFYLTVFFLLSIISTVFFVCITTTTAYSPRYLIPAYSLPILYLTFAINRYGRYLYNQLYIVIAVIFLFLVTTKSIDVGVFEGEKFRYYPAKVECIDWAIKRNGSFKNGIATYWDAKYFQALSRENITLAQFDEKMNEFRWITSKGFYQSTYGFAILPADLEAMQLNLEKLWGKPDNYEKCDDKIIYFYNK